MGESPEGMTAGDPCQIHGRKESSYPSLCQLLEHWHPCETPPLAKRADAFTAALYRSGNVGDLLFHTCVTGWKSGKLEKGIVTEC